MIKSKLTSLLFASALAALPISMITGCALTGGRESVGEYTDDKTVTAKVKTALARDPVVKAHQVNVTTFRGTVQLSGFVDSQEQKDRATEITREIVGVKELRNDLIVPTGRTSGETGLSDDTSIQGETKIKAEDGTIKGEVDVDRK